MSAACAGGTAQKRPLRIAIVSQYFWPEVFPINAMAEGLAERGHAVTVLTGLPNYPGGTVLDGYGWRGPWRQRRGTIEVKRLPLVARGRESRWRLGANYLSFAALSFLSAPWMLGNRFDVVLANQASPLLGIVGALSQRRVHQTPLVTWVQDLWPESLDIAGIRSPWLRAAMDRLMRLTYRRSAFVFLQSKAFASHAARYGVEETRVRYVPNWADPAFRPLEEQDCAAQAAELPPGFRVVVAGNIGEAQDIGTLVEAAKRLRGHPTLRICVIGDGRMRQWLQDRISEQQLAPTLNYIGSRPVGQMPRYLAAADALLLMLRDNPAVALTVPSRLQAYLACGRPVVAAINGEARRIVEQAGAGLGVAAQSPAALSEALLKLAAMPQEERRAMADAALVCSSTEFNADRILDRVESSFYAIAGRGAGVP